MFNLSEVVNFQRQTVSSRARQSSRTALRAIIGARLCASGQAETAAVAAACTGSTAAHVRAGTIILKAEDERLLRRVLFSHISLLEAAKEARRVSKLVDAYRGAGEQDLVKAAKIVGRVFVPTVVAAE
jgi:hypothetical protein